MASLSGIGGRRGDGRAPALLAAYGPDAPALTVGVADACGVATLAACSASMAEAKALIAHRLMSPSKLLLGKARVARAEAPFGRMPANLGLCAGLPCLPGLHGIHGKRHCCPAAAWQVLLPHKRNLESTEIPSLAATAAEAEFCRTEGNSNVT